ncbi:hypothetical protein P4114_24065 [Pseudomonas aeruginosa]|nr:hypothetical protein [Pseudomonas aeruginosa]
MVGLCDGFYVTANRVCLQPSGEHLEGRSLASRYRCWACWTAPN